MAKAVFRPAELINVPETVMISSPVLFQDSAGISLVLEEEGIQERPVVEEYTGPTADDLRREAELFRQQWAIEKEAMIEAAKTEANEIIQTADLSAFQDKQRGDDEAKAVIAAAKEEAEKLITDARRQARELEAQIKATLEEERKTTLEESRETGRLEGYTAGKVEVDRLVERTQLVLERAQNKRGEILTETEQQIIDLVLLITRKVVKVIAENQREVIISNVIQALRKVRDRGNIIIRVNLADLKLTTEHTKEFIQMLEGVKSIQVVEDSSVDSGGCIIETDFGEIDARISSQLAELETRILEISPIKSKIKSGKAQ